MHLPGSHCGRLATEKNGDDGDDDDDEIHRDSPHPYKARRFLGLSADSHVASLAVNAGGFTLSGAFPRALSSTMPFYQIVCITSHFRKYVRAFYFLVHDADRFCSNTSRTSCP